MTGSELSKERNRERNLSLGEDLSCLLGSTTSATFFSENGCGERVDQADKVFAVVISCELFWRVAEEE